MSQLSSKELKEIRRRYSRQLPYDVKDYADSNIGSGKYSLKFLKFINKGSIIGNILDIPISAQVLGNYNTVKFRPFKSIIEIFTDLFSPIKGMLKIALSLYLGLVAVVLLAAAPLMLLLSRLFAVGDNDEDMANSVAKDMIQGPSVLFLVLLVQGVQDILSAPVTLFAKTFFTFKNLGFKNFDDSKIVEEACQIAENALASEDKVALKMALVALHKKSNHGKLSLDIEKECTLFEKIDTDVLQREKAFNPATAKILTNQYLSFFKRPAASSETTPARVPPLV